MNLTIRFSTVVFAIASFFFFASSLQAQNTKSEKAVINLLNQQSADWNRGDIEAFMQGYWNSPHLTFIGSRGVTNGWDETLANYKKGYPDKAAMGKLRFELSDVRQLSSKVVSVVGKFILDRKDETLDGHFLLIVKKIKGKWLLVADHTS